MQNKPDAPEFLLERLTANLNAEFIPPFLQLHADRAVQ